MRISQTCNMQPGMGAVASLAMVTLAACAPASVDAPGEPAASAATLRIATFNAYLNRQSDGALIDELTAGGNRQIEAVAEIIQRVNPDVILLNEIDRDNIGRTATLFASYFLARGWNGAEAIEYPYIYMGPVNTGLPSGFDLNRDGVIASEPGSRAYGDDAIGFGAFRGQYAMALFSKYPIDDDRVRTFQTFLWKDMPGALLPDDPDTGAAGGWYSAEALSVMRLSSKSHWDIPVSVGGRTVHILASHPTPPAFDGPEQRNVRRNHDEIRLWADYLTPERAGYIRDDAGGTGGLAPGARFVILGDLNADPADGAGWPGAMAQLLSHPAVDASVVPSSAGAVAAAERQGGANLRHKGDPAADTADFLDLGERAPGNLRVDYVLPSRAGLRVTDAGVFWPAPDAPHFDLVGAGWPIVSSDHRLVWIDVELTDD